MTRVQCRLLAILMAAMLYPTWGYGGHNKQSGALTAPVHQNFGQVYDNQEAELAVLDAGKGAAWTGDDRRKVQALFASLKERDIAIQPTFYKMLGMAPPARQGKLVSHCQLFFGNVDTLEITNTGSLTGMICTQGQVCTFLSYSEDSVRRVARTPALKSLASLFNKRGFPRPEEDTQAFTEWNIWWQGEGRARTLDRELLRTVSAMFTGKGLPNKKAVEDFLELDIWWQGEGEARLLDRELLRSFSSMFCGKGLPDKKAVKDYLQWEIWWQEEDGARTLDRELLRAFSSMFARRGFPEKKAVEDYLRWGIWWQGEDGARTLDRQLLRAFSGMFNSRGLPKKNGVDAYLKWDIWWHIDGEVRTLDRELLRIFSSMFHRKGLPSKEAVDDYLKLDVWWREKDGVCTLDRELLRVFSSMLHSKGLPDQQAVKEYLLLDIWWQGEGNARVLDRELLHAFSSMFHGKGLPDTQAVQEYLQFDVWWQGEGHGRTLDRELLRIFSSMFNGRGLPDKQAVVDYLRWGIWWQREGATPTLDRKLLRSFSAMFNGKGLPNKFCVDEIVKWLTWHGQPERRAIKVMADLYSGTFSGHGSLGCPNINKLKQAEQKLRALIGLEAREFDQDDDILLLIKMVVLYLANDWGTRQLGWTTCSAWLQAYLAFVPKKPLLRQLLLTLHYHGGRGIKDAVTLISGKPVETKKFVLEALSSGQALASVQYALRAIEPSDWREYLFFSRGFPSVLSIQQWQTIKGYLDAFSPVLPNREYQRQFLTLIWPLVTDQEQFVRPEALGRLATLLPSVQVLRKLSKSLTIVELRTLFDTYLAYQGEPPVIYLTVAMLRKLLKNRVPMNPVIWASADYHKDQLSPSLLALLKERAEADRGVLVPENLKAFLSRYDRQVQGCTAAVHDDQASPPPSATPAVWLETALGKDVLNEADLDRLYAYQNQLTCDQVVDILLRIDQSVYQESVQRWYALLGEKHQQALKTSPPWLDGSNEVMGTVRDVEDILRDLFPDDLSYD